jgi:hypothetical protein
LRSCAVCSVARATVDCVVVGRGGRRRLGTSLGRRGGPGIGLRAFPARRTVRIAGPDPTSAAPTPNAELPRTKSRRESPRSDVGATASSRPSCASSAAPFLPALGPLPANRATPVRQLRASGESTVCTHNESEQHLYLDSRPQLPGLWRPLAQLKGAARGRGVVMRNIARSLWAAIMSVRSLHQKSRRATCRAFGSSGMGRPTGPRRDAR